MTVTSLRPSTCGPYVVKAKGMALPQQSQHETTSRSRMSWWAAWRLRRVRPLLAYHGKLRLLAILDLTLRAHVAVKTILLVLATAWLPVPPARAALTSAVQRGSCTVRGLQLSWRLYWTW